MKRSIFVLATLTAGLTLTGCDIANQDGNGEDNRSGLNGLAVDGRVAGGKVWADMNNNNKIDDFEPYAYTDAQGYYSYNPVSNTNYCALPVISDEFQRHCLKYGSSLDNVMVRIKGGTDLGTGEKLKGVMAMSTTISESSERSQLPLVLSPITTLLSTVQDDTEQRDLKTALGIESDNDLRIDFSTADNAKNKALLAHAVSVQTMMDVLANSADDTSDEDELQLTLIERISQQVTTAGRSPSQFNSDDFGPLMETVTTDTNKRTSVSSRLTDLNSVIDNIRNAADENEVKAKLKAAEVVSQLVKKESTGDDSDEDNQAARKVLDSGISALSDSLESSMNDDTVEFDIGTITNTLVDQGKDAVTNDTDFDDSGISDAVNDSKLATGTVWGGSWFVLEASAEESDDLAAGSYLAVRLDGTEDSDSGRLGVCVNASPAEGGSSDETFTNEYIGGSWTKISAGAVILTLNYEGQEFEGQMKARVQEDGQPQEFRFTSEVDGTNESGDLVLNANSVSALANVAKPGSSEDCANNVDTQI